MEIATHSSHHSNFNNADTSPRDYFDEEEYRNEITHFQKKPLLDHSRVVSYVGRIPPKEKDDGTGLDPIGTIGWINQWQRNNENDGV